MLFRCTFGTALLAVALVSGAGDAAAFDESKYPDLKGQWRRAERGDLAGGFGGLRYDSTKPPLLGQEAPLTPEYQAIYEANRADQAAGGQGIESTFTCLSPGMPRVMLAYAPMADTTYILIEHIHDNRRIHTDGRSFPDNMDEDPMFSGYSIGKQAILPVRRAIAPRSMKMGTIRSPWRYDVATHHALRSANLRWPAIFHHSSSATLVPTVAILGAKREGQEAGGG